MCYGPNELQYFKAMVSMENLDMRSGQIAFDLWAAAALIVGLSHALHSHQPLTS